MIASFVCVCVCVSYTPSLMGELTIAMFTFKLITYYIVLQSTYPMT